MVLANLTASGARCAVLSRNGTEGSAPPLAIDFQCEYSASDVVPNAVTFAVGSSPDGADLGTFTVNASQSSNSAWGTYIFPRDAFAEGDIVHTSVTCANARGQTTASCGGAVIDGLPPQSGSLALQGAKWDDRTEAWHLPEPGSARLEWQGFADGGTGIAGYLLCVGAASSGCERWVANFSGANRWARVPLEAGESYLTLWAEDGMGQRASTSTAVFVHDVGPAIANLSAEPGQVLDGCGQWRHRPRSNRRD